MAKGCDLEKKRQDMYEYYKELIHEEGERATLFEKNYFYERVADKFYVTRAYAAQVIRKQIKLEKSKNA